MGVDKKKPRKTRGPYCKRACTHCKQAKAKCDNFRPCKRCIKLGLQHECVDAVRSKAKTRRKRKRNDVQGNAKNQNSQVSRTLELSKKMKTVNGNRSLSKVPKKKNTINQFDISMMDPNLLPKKSSIMGRNLNEYLQYTKIPKAPSVNQGNFQQLTNGGKKYNSQITPFGNQNLSNNGYNGRNTMQIAKYKKPKKQLSIDTTYNSLNKRNSVINSPNNFAAIEGFSSPTDLDSLNNQLQVLDLNSPPTPILDQDLTGYDNLYDADDKGVMAFSPDILDSTGSNPFEEEMGALSPMDFDPNRNPFSQNELGKQGNVNMNQNPFLDEPFVKEEDKDADLFMNLDDVEVDPITDNDFSQGLPDLNFDIQKNEFDTNNTPKVNNNTLGLRNNFQTNQPTNNSAIQNININKMGENELDDFSGLLSQLMNVVNERKQKIGSKNPPNGKN